MFKTSTKLLHLLISFALLVGCGFHLRGTFDIPKAFQILKISPNQPFDNFQRSLKQTLVSNGVQVIPEGNPQALEYVTLTLVSQAFSERTVAYGSDGQPNRAILKFKVIYQLTDSQGKLIVPATSVQVERELTINPSAYLATDNERTRLRNDLTVDAASLLVRQLSFTPISQE